MSLWFRSICLILLATLFSCQRCEKASGDLSVETLQGRTLTGHVTSATGSLSQNLGLEFTVWYKKDGTFRLKTKGDATWRDEGQYTYQKVDGLTGLIKETHLFGATQVPLEVTLRFNSRDGGTFELHTTTGEEGTESGIFDLD